MLDVFFCVFVCSLYIISRNHPNSFCWWSCRKQKLVQKNCSKGYLFRYEDFDSLHRFLSITPNFPLFEKSGEEKKKKRDNYKTKSYAFQANAKKFMVLKSLIVNCEKSQRVLHQQLFEQFQVNGKGNKTPPIFWNVFLIQLVFVGYGICSTSFVSKRQQFTDILPNNCSENLKRFLKLAHPW